MFRASYQKNCCYKIKKLYASSEDITSVNLRRLSLNKNIYQLCQYQSLEDLQRLYNLSKIENTICFTSVFFFSVEEAEVLLKMVGYNVFLKIRDKNFKIFKNCNNFEIFYLFTNLILVFKSPFFYLLTPFPLLRAV